VNVIAKGVIGLSALAGSLLTIAYLATSQPRLVGSPPSPTCIGAKWTWFLFGFAPNSPVSVTVVKNGVKLSGCVQDDPSIGCLSTDSNGNLVINNIIGPSDFGTWQNVIVADSKGNHSSARNFTIVQATNC
jgi:hypothetical protein